MTPGLTLEQVSQLLPPGDDWSCQERPIKHALPANVTRKMRRMATRTGVRSWPTSNSAPSERSFLEVRCPICSTNKVTAPSSGKDVITMLSSSCSAHRLPASPQQLLGTRVDHIILSEHGVDLWFSDGSVHRLDEATEP